MSNVSNVIDFKVRFVDAKDNRCNVHVTNKDGYFSFTGECNGSFGQCQDSIMPATRAQKELLHLWQTYHLNNLHAGTEWQDEWFKMNGYDRRQCTWKNGECYVRHNDELVLVPRDNGYVYGTQWLTRNVPEDLTDTLTRIISTINQEYEDSLSIIFNGENIVDIHSKDMYPDDEALAISKICEIPIEDAMDIDTSDNEFSYQGIDYYIGTNEELMAKAKDYLSEDYIGKEWWKEAVKSDKTEDSLSDWLDEVLNNDGWETILGSYSGKPEGDYNGIYIIRR